MEDLTSIGFLDVPVLLEASQPQPRVPWLWLAAGGCLAFMVVSWFVGHDSPMAGALQLTATLLAMGIFFALPILFRFTLRKIRAEQQIVLGVAELVHLRRWPEAAVALQQLLSRPARTTQIRSEALIYLASILSRYHRFNDAISVHNYLLENELVGGAAAYGLKMGRAMAMLREDHLFDADRAINDLRRQGPEDSAGFALIDMYRDVKTGHPEDALKVFEASLPIMRDQLGHRLGDAYALAARAYDLLDRKVEAADAFRRATLLTPLIELCRRYPEIQKLLGRYEPATAPPEMA
jgi:tetratricopeptide (TPR) repeat protein